MITTTTTTTTTRFSKFLIPYNKNYYYNYYNNYNYRSQAQQQQQQQQQQQYHLNFSTLLVDQFIRPTTTTTTTITSSTRRHSKKTHIPKEQVPKWLKELETKQSSSLTFYESSSNDNKDGPNNNSNNNGSSSSSSSEEEEEEVVIYRAKMKDDWRGSPNRVGISMIGLLLASGYFAQQIRHHGAGPSWSNPKSSSWSEFDLVPWHSTTRFLVASTIITFSTYRSFTFFLTLSHTIRKITIPVGTRSLTPTTNLKFYSIGSQDLIWPLNQLFPPITSSPNQFFSFGRLTNRPRPLNPFVTALGSQPISGALIPLKPLHSGLSLQLPLDGTWGSPHLDAQSIKAALEDAFKYFPNLNDPSLPSMIGFDPRQPLAFNFKVLSALLARALEYIRSLFSPSARA